MSKLNLCAAMLLATALLIGCGSQPGSTVVKYTKGGATMLTEAPEDGVYALYSSNDTTPKVTFPLKKGDKVGFKEADEKVWAIAGDRDPIPVEVGTFVRTFYWKMQRPK